MGIPITPAQVGGGRQSPEVMSYPIESDAEFIKGALVTIDNASAGAVEEHGGGATVTGVLGIAQGGTSAAGVLDFGDEVPVAIANTQTRFLGQAYDGGAPITDCSAVKVGDQYGLIKHTDNLWYVDLDDTTNVLVEVVKVVDFGSYDLILFKFLASTLEQTV